MKSSKEMGIQSEKEAGLLFSTKKFKEIGGNFIVFGAISWGLVPHFPWIQTDTDLRNIVSKGYDILHPKCKSQLSE